MECEEVLIRLWEYLDDELGPEDARALKTHLQDCQGCYPKYRRDRLFLLVLARQRTNCSAPAALRISLLTQLRAS
jgi:mycothiol system anti-sigma-R factor